MGGIAVGGRQEAADAPVSTRRWLLSGRAAGQELRLSGMTAAENLELRVLSRYCTRLIRARLANSARCRSTSVRVEGVVTRSTTAPSPRTIEAPLGGSGAPLSTALTGRGWRHHPNGWVSAELRRAEAGYLAFGHGEDAESLIERSRWDRGARGGLWRAKRCGETGEGLSVGNKMNLSPLERYSIVVLQMALARFWCRSLVHGLADVVTEGPGFRSQACVSTPSDVLAIQACLRLRHPSWYSEGSDTIVQLQMKLEFSYSIYHKSHQRYLRRRKIRECEDGEFHDRRLESYGYRMSHKLPCSSRLRPKLYSLVAVPWRHGTSCSHLVWTTTAE